MTLLSVWPAGLGTVELSNVANTFSLLFLSSHNINFIIPMVADYFPNEVCGSLITFSKFPHCVGDSNNCSQTFPGCSQYLLLILFM